MQLRSLTAAVVAVTLAACSRTGTGAGVRADITARMQSIQEPIAACYATALQGNRKVRGMMVVSFQAAAGSGKFELVNVGRDEPGDPGLRACVIAQVAALTLATPQRTAVSVSYPIRFAPSN